MFHKSLPSSSLFEGAINSSYRLVGFRSRESVEQFHEAHGGFAMWLDPFGCWSRSAVNLLPALGVGVDLRRHGNFFLFFLSKIGQFRRFRGPYLLTLVQCDFEIDILLYPVKYFAGEGIARWRLTYYPLLCYPAVFATKISLHFSPTPTHRRWFLSLCRRRVIFEQELAEETEF